jgi:hypothetical protein
MATEVGTNGCQGKPTLAVFPRAESTDAGPWPMPGATGGLFGGVIIVNPAGGGASRSCPYRAGQFLPEQFRRGLQEHRFDHARLRRRGNRKRFTTRHAVLVDLDQRQRCGHCRFCWATRSRTNTLLDTGTKSQTVVIITSRRSTLTFNPGQRAPFTIDLHHLSSARANVPSAVVFNREEASPQIVTSVDFSPQVPGSLDRRSASKPPPSISRRQHLRLDQQQTLTTRVLAMAGRRSVQRPGAGGGSRA